MAGWGLQMAVLGVVLGGGSPLVAQGPVRVVPEVQVLVGGETCGFRVEQGSSADWCWSLAGAAGPSEPVEPLPGGSLTAPLVAEVRRFQLRAASCLDPGLSGAAVLTVLPRDLFFRQTPGHPPEAFPFLIPGAKRRYGDNLTVQTWYPPRSRVPSTSLVAGYDLPVTLRWETPLGSEAELLSYREGNAVRCLDVTGLNAVTLVFRAPVSNCALEALRHGAGGARAWKSHLQRFVVLVRGLVPFVGDPAELGSALGQGPSAALREPLGLTVLGGGLHCPARLVVADPGSHTLRAVSREGETLAKWGQAGERGYRDGAPEAARFDQPSFTAVNRWFPVPEPYQYSSGFVLSEAGSHAIRAIDEQGWVSTLAGCPGQAGYQDADDPRQALFNRPQGLVMDAQGTVFVADQGNQVIRRIARGGPVTTLAGLAGQAGDQDGQGVQARFSRLAGLTEAGDGHLYVVDGHALRRVTKAGAVTTLLGTPLQPGFRDIGAGAGSLAGLPCLRDPRGLAAAWKRLYLADEGNRAVRAFDLDGGALVTLAGDPAVAQTRPGLLRDGLAGPLAAEYAALAAPRALAVGPNGDVYVSAGCEVLRLCLQQLACASSSGLDLRVEPAAVGLGQPCEVLFSLPARPQLGFRYWLEFRNADGSLAERVEGFGEGGRWGSGQGRFAKPGPGSVHLGCVTDQGFSLGARAQVVVLP